MTIEVGVQLDVEVGVRATPTSLLFLCTKAFPAIQVGVGQKLAKISQEIHRDAF